MISDNCTREQQIALSQLKGMKYVIIKPSDKEEEAARQLHDADCYKRLTFNPLSKFQMELSIIIQRAVDQSILTEQQGKCLLIEYPCGATLYLLPKVHITGSKND